MTHQEAKTHAKTLNKYPDMYAEVVRILPQHIDPPQPNDNGWDVKVTRLYVA